MSLLESLNNVDEITEKMKEAIKKGTNKIKEKRKRASNKSSGNQSDVIQICIPSGGSSNGESETANQGKILTNVPEEGIKICKGEKRKGGRCSRKAKNGEYCEIHTTDRKEMERKLEGGIYKYRDEKDVYDIEEIMRRMVREG